MDPRTPEIIYVDAHDETVGCDGGGGALGHPMVYYTFGRSHVVECGYCSRRFVRRAAGHAPEGGTPPAPVDPRPIDPVSPA